MGCLAVPHSKSCFDWTVTVGQHVGANLKNFCIFIFFQNLYGKGFVFEHLFWFTPQYDIEKDLMKFTIHATLFIKNFILQKK